MAVETDADTKTMLADFGRLVLFTPGDSYPNRNDDTVEITAIFDTAFFEITGDESDADSKQPKLLARTLDAADAARNSMVEIGADVYKVVGVEADGTADPAGGFTVLALEGPK